MRLYKLLFITFEKPICMPNCPKCNAPVETDAKFCPKCGANLENSNVENLVCPVCHKTYPVGSQFCEADGAKLVTPDKLVPRCVICGQEYSADTKFCPKDGGAIMSEAERMNQSGFVKAPLGERILAYILDCLISTALALPAIFFYVLAFIKIEDGSEATIMICFVIALLLYLLPLVYQFIKDGLGEGQSYGKKIMKLKVVSVNDRTNCTKAISCLRTLITYLLCCIPFVGWLIELIVAATDKDGRRLADKVAGTIVIDNKN